MNIKILTAFLLFVFGTTFYGHTQSASLGVITGKVTAKDDGAAAARATVTVKNESTGFTASTVAVDNGDYIFNQLPLGTPYSVTVSFAGYGSQRKTGYTLNQGDRLEVDFELEKSSTELGEVTVVASTVRKSINSVGAATTISPKEMNKMPVNGRNFTSLIDLSPVANGTSIGGQLASSTNFTIDGMTARGTIAGGNTSGAYSISMEAIREFKVVNNEYDVTEGRAGGGTISTVTKSGTNTLTGSVFTFGRTDWLSSQYDIRGNKRDQPFATYQYGFSLGGPIVKDKAHFFLVWDHQYDSRPLYIANVQSPADEAAYNVTNETLDRFSGIARTSYGVSDNPQFGSFDKRKKTDAIFGRIDWQLNSRNLLSIRNNYVFEFDKLSEGDNSGINAFESWIDRRKINNSLIVSLRSELNPRLTNELKVQQFLQNEFVLPSPELPAAGIPRAIVENVASPSGDKTYFTSIQIGGQRFSPEWFKGSVYQLVNNLFYNTGKIKYTLGVDVAYTRMYNRYGSEMNGRFFFTGMENFENKTPYRYAREIAIVDDPSTVLNQLSSGVYGQMETRIARGLNLLAGIRLDNTQYLNAANYSPVVDKQLGIATNNRINTLQFQPRFELMWNVNDNGKDYIRFGAGIFGSNLNPYSMINNILFDGTKIAAVDIEGNLVPTPDFELYRQNPATAPGAELFENGNIEKLVTINTNAPDAKVPTVYKTSLTYNHLFSDRLRLGISGYASMARNNYMYVDRNMVDQPYFTIEEEAGRGVFVPAESINPKNGSANWVNGRKTTEVGRVLELVSDGRKNQFAVVVDGTFRYYKDGQITASYTWNDAKDNTSYNGNVANSATLSLMVKDDPRDLSTMAYADNHFRSKVVVYANAPSVFGITAGLRFSGIGGTRYSLAVGGNMNGDFVNSNDLAYVYDPTNAATPDYLKTGIQAILDNPEVEQGLKDYVMRSFGSIAERNGGVNGFYGVVDLRLAKKFNFFKSHSLEASVDVFNLANMLKKEWGVSRILGKQNIYTIKSFDNEAQKYVYNVRTTTGVSSLGGTPFQVQLGLRYGF